MKRGKELKRWMMLCASFSILFSIVSPTGQASELDKVNQQIKQLQNEQRNAENKQQQAEWLKAKATKMLGKTKKDVNYVRSEINKKTHEISNISHKIDTTELHLKQAARELQQANERIAERKNFLDTRLCLMYMDGNVPYVEVLFNTKSTADFLDRFDLLQTIASQDKEILAEHKRDKQLVVQKKQEIATNLKEVRHLYAKLDDTKRKLMLKEKEKEVMISNYNQTIEESDDISEEQDRLLVEIIRKRAKLMKKKKKLLKPKRIPTRKKWKRTLQTAHTGGRLNSPLRDRYHISSPFGSRIDPVTGRRGAFHSGLDMATSGGTAIYAAEAGTVQMAEWWSGFGNCVVIDHDNGLWTLYGHIRNGGIKVKRGEQVARGDKIAEVGSTGRSTGNHLHFEVRLHGKRVNPMPYLQ